MLQRVNFEGDSTCGYRYSSIFYPSLRVVGIQAPNSILLMESRFCAFWHRSVPLWPKFFQICIRIKLLVKQSVFISVGTVGADTHLLSSYSCTVLLQMPEILIIQVASLGRYGASLLPSEHTYLDTGKYMISVPSAPKVIAWSCRYPAAISWLLWFPWEAQNKSRGCSPNTVMPASHCWVFCVCDAKYSLSTLLNLWFSGLKSNVQGWN